MVGLDLNSFCYESSLRHKTASKNDQPVALLNWTRSTCFTTLIHHRHLYIFATSYIWFLVGFRSALQIQIQRSILCEKGDICIWEMRELCKKDKQLKTTKRTNNWKISKNNPGCEFSLSKIYMSYMTYMSKTLLKIGDWIWLLLK